MTEVKVKLIALLDQLRDNVVTGTFDNQELACLYEFFSEFFIEGRPDKGILVSSEAIDRQTMFYTFLGWWICYLKNNDEGE